MRHLLVLFSVFAPVVALADGGLPFIEPQYHADVEGMVQRLTASHPACMQRLDRMTVAKSSTVGTASNPSFFVQCGDAQVPEVVRFTLEEARSAAVPVAARPIAEPAAKSACRDAARERAELPGSVDFSMIMDAVYNARPNGMVTLSSTFTALNRMGVETKYFIQCRFDGESLADVSIKPAA